MAYTPAVGDMPAFTAEEIANAKAYFNQVGSLDQIIQEATAAGYTPEQVASLYAQSMPEQGVGYAQALSIFNEQAAKTPMTNPLQEFVANNTPTDEQINENNRLRYGTADEVGLQDVVNNMGSANTGTMLTNQGTQLSQQGTQFTPEQLNASKIFFKEMQRRIAAGEDVSGIIDARRQELGLTPNQVASLFTQSMGTDPSVANNAVNAYLGIQGKAPINFYSQQPMTQASPGVVPTLRPQPVQGVDTPGMMSTGFQSPVPSSIADLFSSVQGVRDINQGYLSAPRTDLSQLRSDLEAQYAAQAQAAQLQQQAQYNAVMGGGGGDNNGTGLTPQQIAFLEAELPEERDYRMRQINQFLTPGYVTALNNKFGNYESSYGTTTDNSSLSSAEKAGLAEAKSTFGYGSDKDFFGG
jgi:hypothetical protein